MHTDEDLDMITGVAGTAAGGLLGWHLRIFRRLQS
jgi:hypothetical protein